MSAAPASDALEAGPSLHQHLQALPGRTYGLRVLGMGLGSLPIGAVLHELGPHWAVWAWMAAACFVWPHLAYWRARCSRDPVREELRNYGIDSFIAASFAPLMHFNLLPSVVLVAVALADKLNTGIRGLWLRSLPGMVAAVLGGGLLTGFAVRLDASRAVVLATLPILVLHTLLVALSSYRLVRRVQRQNLELESLSRTDALTGLYNRGHWETAAAALVRQHTPAAPLSLMLVDLDMFKEINDAHGHATGDDVLRAIASILRRHAGAGGLPGRLGGDEFVLAARLALGEIEALAERVRAEVEALRFDHAPALRCSVSIGVAAPHGAGADLRMWIEAADRSLYRAKQNGRNRTSSQGGVATRVAVPG